MNLIKKVYKVHSFITTTSRKMHRLFTVLANAENLFRVCRFIDIFTPPCRAFSVARVNMQR